MDRVQALHLEDRSAFAAFSDAWETAHPGLRFSLVHGMGDETLLHADFGGMKVHWLYEGGGEVFLPKGTRTKEGDGDALPASYRPQPMDARFAELLECLAAQFGTMHPAAQAPLRAILDRRRKDAYVGDCANDLWKLAHTPRPWAKEAEVETLLAALLLQYRAAGYSVKQEDSFEPVCAGDQLITAGAETLRVRGRFSCLCIEKKDRAESHIPAAMRLKYLRDSSGGCNFDFDPFRRLPLTWHMNLPGESGDGINFVNSHVVNIASETSPTHVHPRIPIGGGLAQNECYLVLDPDTHGINTYGREPHLIVFPDLGDLRRFERHPLRPGSFVYIPAGTGHRGMDAFVNVITVPGFKPHNEFYIDQDIGEQGGGTAPFNAGLRSLKNYSALGELT